MPPIRKIRDYTDTCRAYFCDCFKLFIGRCMNFIGTSWPAEMVFHGVVGIISCSPREGASNVLNKVPRKHMSIWLISLRKIILQRISQMIKSIYQNVALGCFSDVVFFWCLDAMGTECWGISFSAGVKESFAPREFIQGVYIRLYGRITHLLAT